jgi:Kef-type K+ transport system membrane component KefB
MYELLVNFFSSVKEFFVTDSLPLLGLVLVFGYYFGIVARRFRLPSLIGFMVLGVILGPSGFSYFFIDHRTSTGNLESLEFVVQICLGFVAVLIGSELSLKGLVRLGKGIIYLILSESFCAFFLVTLLVYLFSGNLPLALLFGAIAPASAPAGTVAVIKEYRAKGKLTQALYAVVGFDDGLAIIIFAFAVALAKSILLINIGALGVSENIVRAMITPLEEIAASLLIGIIFGYSLYKFVKRHSVPQDNLVFLVGIIFFTTGLCVHFHYSLILANMTVGFMLVNLGGEQIVNRMMTPLENLMPIIFILFFALAGAHLELEILTDLGMLGIVYILGRSTGLIGGAFLGSLIGRLDKQIRNYVGFGILSQAGVAIGLSLIVSHDWKRLMEKSEVQTALSKLPEAVALKYDPVMMSDCLLTTITATCIIFEIIGPIGAKYALMKAGETQEKELKDAESIVDL